MQLKVINCNSIITSALQPTQGSRHSMAMITQFLGVDELSTVSQKSPLNDFRAAAWDDARRKVCRTLDC
eukprot:6212189-Pleurochrysis_carterae.AAC.11